MRRDRMGRARRAAAQASTIGRSSIPRISDGMFGGHLDGFLEIRALEDVEPRGWSIRLNTRTGVEFGLAPFGMLQIAVTSTASRTSPCKCTPRCSISDTQAEPVPVFRGPPD